MQICGVVYWRVGSDYIKYLAIATGCLSLTHSLPSGALEPSNWNKHWAIVRIVDNAAMQWMILMARLFYFISIW